MELRASLHVPPPGVLARRAPLLQVDNAIGAFFLRM
jgi:hypothetical protein